MPQPCRIVHRATPHRAAMQLFRESRLPPNVLIPPSSLPAPSGWLPPRSRLAPGFRLAIRPPTVIYMEVDLPDHLVRVYAERGCSPPLYPPLYVPYHFKQIISPPPHIVPLPPKLWPIAFVPHQGTVPLPLALYLFRSTRGVSTLPKHIVKRIIQFGTPVGTESRLHLPPYRFQ